MKRIISALLTLCVAFSIFAGVGFTASAATYDVFTYTVNNGKATITDCNDAAYGAVTIPNTINGYTVTAIGDYAFKNCFSITNITIPDSVTTIGEAAFSFCTNLTSIKIPNGVTSISDFLLFGCRNLVSVTLPNGVTTIGNYAFHACDKLLSFKLPNSLKSIGNDAFSWSFSFTSLTIPDNVTSIGERAFEYCYGISSLSVSSGNKTFYSNGNCIIERATNKLVLGCKNSVIPSGVTSIGKWAFSGCEYLQSLTIPNTITKIERNAFIDCNRITNVVIPNSVTTIEQEVFKSCGSLVRVTLPNKLTSIEYAVFDCCIKLTDVTIPNSVTKIGIDAFANCDSLKSISIPSSVTTISAWAFAFCPNLSKIVVPSSVTTIDEDAFFKSDAVVIYGDVGSAAHVYAVNNNIPFSVGIFPDVFVGTWYYDAVNYVYSSGIMTGYANGYFGTADGIQRQDFLVMLARYDGANLNEYAKANAEFPDVSANSYYEAAVNWGYQNGIVTGYENGNFGVGDLINREQLVTFLYRYSKYKEMSTFVPPLSEEEIVVKYADYKDVSPYAQPAVLWAIHRGVISGKNGNEIAPVAGAQRCEVAQIMYNIDKKGIFA